MNQEVRQCQNCKTQFTIEPDDFAFYKKINVPPPTFCPECRLQRRLSFANLIQLYKRPCDLCKKESISLYAPGAPYTVYCPRCWWGDGWDPFVYGRDYDFSRPFFEQFNALFHQVPLLGLSLDLPTAEASPYNNHAGHLKNCYLLFHADFVEDSAYGFITMHNKSVFDSSLIVLSELCYDMMNSFKNHRCIGGRGNVVESLECAFLRDCDNCQNCFASANLRNKKYYIFNKPYTKEEYLEEIKKWDLGSYKTYQALKREAETHWKKFPPRPAYDDFSIHSTGSYVFQSKNCKECYEVAEAEDCKYLLMASAAPLRDCYDLTSWGNNLTLAYECGSVGEAASNLRFCQESGINLYNAEYSKLSTGGSNHFGCVSMKKGNYCVFNKPYPEKEFAELRARIIGHMNAAPYTDKRGRVYRYGEFFPIELSPFSYNETFAQTLLPLSKERALAEGYSWREPERKEHAVTVQAAGLPDHIKDAPDSLLQGVIGCEQCGRGYKVIPMELQFLRRMNLPLPRLCPFCRIGDRIKEWRGHIRSLPRTCGKCGREFKTHYTKEDAEYVLCKPCYQAEVV